MRSRGKWANALPIDLPPYTNRRQCEAWTLANQASGFTSHRCGNHAKPRSIYCHVHSKRRAAKPPEYRP
jgi:hypothetical protein